MVCESSRPLSQHTELLATEIEVARVYETMSEQERGDCGEKLERRHNLIVTRYNTGKHHQTPLQACQKLYCYETKVGRSPALHT